MIAGDYGKLEIYWRFELLDKERNVINSDLKTLVDGSLDFVRSRRIRGGGQLVFRKVDLSLDGYAELVLASSPIFYWRLGDASGTTAEDASPNNRDGTYNNTPTLNAGSLLRGAVENGAVTLNGSNEFVRIADNAAFDVSTLTIEFWAKTVSTATERIAERDDDDSNHAWVVFQTVGEIRFRVYISTVAITAATGIVINDGKPHHIACTYNGAFMRVYVDGSQIYKQAQTGNVDSVNSGINLGAFRQLFNLFTGTLDEFAFYGAALPAQVIRQHYQAGANQLEEINFRTDRVKVYQRMVMADGGYVEYPRGEYLLGHPVVRETETGTRYEVLAFDKVKKLDDYGFESRYVIAAGTLYTTAISNLLALVYLNGEYSVSTTSTATLPASMSFQIGDNLLDAVNKLATAIHYGNVYADATGQVIVEEYVEPSSRAVDDEWDVDNGQSFLSWERELSSNYNETKNYVIAKSVSSKNGTIERAVAINNNASHPTNYGDVGRRTFVYEVQAADSGTLQQIANRKLIEVSAPVERFHTQSVFRPFYQNEEKVRVIEDGEADEYYFEERHVSLSGKPPFLESYVMTKVYSF